MISDVGSAEAQCQDTPSDAVSAQLSIPMVSSRLSGVLYRIGFTSHLTSATVTIVPRL